MEIQNDEHFGVESDIPKFVMVPNWVLEIRLNEEPLPPQAIHIYTVLMYHVNNETRKCFPAYTTLESMTGMSRSTIWKYLNILKDAGVLTWERRSFKGFTTSNKYFLPHKPLKEVNLAKQENFIKEEKLPEKVSAESFDIVLDESEDTGFAVPDDIRKKKMADAYWQEMGKVFGYFPKDKSTYGRWVNVIGVIKTLTDDPTDIPKAALNYPKFMPKGATFTLEALGKHFEALMNYKDESIDVLTRLENLKVDENIIDV
jgi:hypothetical protein